MAGKYSEAKTITTYVLAGAVADMSVALATEKVWGKGVAVATIDRLNIYSSDIIGDVFGAAVLLAGWKKNNTKLMMVGAGGLGISLGNFLNRIVQVYGFNQNMVLR